MLNVNWRTSNDAVLDEQENFSLYSVNRTMPEKPKDMQLTLKNHHSIFYIAFKEDMQLQLLHISGNETKNAS